MRIIISDWKKKSKEVGVKVKTNDNFGCVLVEQELKRKSKNNEWVW